MEREEQEKMQKLKEAEVVVLTENRNAKRKAEEKEHESRGKKKKPKTEESPKPESPERKALTPGTVEGQPAEDEDEAWQRQMVEEMAMEEEAQAPPEPVPPKMTKAEAAKQIFDVPAKVDISLEEGKALFKVRFSIFFPSMLTTRVGPIAREGYQPPASLGEIITAIR